MCQARNCFGLISWDLIRMVVVLSFLRWINKVHRCWIPCPRSQSEKARSKGLKPSLLLLNASLGMFSHSLVCLIVQCSPLYVTILISFQQRRKMKIYPFTNTKRSYTYIKEELFPSPFGLLNSFSQSWLHILKRKEH